MPERLLLTGNHAAAYGAMLAKSEVISAYPITPQTMIVELLSELTASTPSITKLCFFFKWLPKT